MGGLGRAFRGMTPNQRAGVLAGASVVTLGGLTGPSLYRKHKHRKQTREFLGTPEGQKVVHAIAVSRVAKKMREQGQTVTINPRVRQDFQQGITAYRERYGR